MAEAPAINQSGLHVAGDATAAESRVAENVQTDVSYGATSNDLAAKETHSPLSFTLTDIRQITRRIWLMWGFHNLSLLAAGVAFFSFLAITPLIAALVFVYGLVADVETVQRQISSLISVVPADVASVLESQLLQVISSSSTASGIGLVVALALSIYSGFNAVSGMIAALNVIYSELESRSFLALTRRALVLTLAATMIGLTGLIGGGAFAWLTSLAASRMEVTLLLLKGLAWLVAFGLGATGFALIMRYGPDRRPAKWRWLTPGAIVATMLWVLTSFFFSLYVAYVSDYSATYGSLSGVVAFVMWLYLSAYGALLGALINAELERQTAADSTHGQDRPLGQRRAVVADTVVTNALTEAYLQKRKRRVEDRLARKSLKVPNLDISAAGPSVGMN